MDTNRATRPRTRPRPGRHLRSTSIAVVLAALTALVGLPALSGIATGAVSSRYSASAESSIADIQTFWSDTLPAVYGTAYEPIPATRLFPYSESNPPPACDGSGGTTPYEQVAGNAFYCSQGDFVAWDEQQLIPSFRAKFGDFAVGLVLAHEWGHAIQARVGTPDWPTVYVELQADCFAGAWGQHVATSTDAGVHLSTADLDAALAGFLQLRDPSGVDPSQDGAHGNAFDRVGAFQDGYDRGVAACRDYTNRPPAVTESAYTSYADQADGGNLPLGDVLPATTASLGEYWSNTLDSYGADPKVQSTEGQASSCATDGGVLDDGVTYSAATDTISYDPAALQRAYDSAGDFGAGVLVAAEWSSAMQHRLGSAVGTSATRSGANCLTGAWAGAVAADSSTGSRFSLSPGDLDEVVATMVGAEGTAGTDRGSAFDRVAAFRTGFLGGAEACTRA